LRKLSALALFVAGACWPVCASAQQRTNTFAADTTTPPGTSVGGIAFIASAILPGGGQWYLKTDRWVPFAAVEAWSWVKYLQNRHRGKQLEAGYRDLAWNVARRITTSSRKDSVFTYYEAIGAWQQSGLFDLDPNAAGIQPERDSTTFNGSQWQRARSLFLHGGPPIPGSADYEKALAYYRANAIPDPYLWSWGSNRLEQAEFKETITESDARFRAATRMMGVILANHVVSAVDALVLARVRSLGEHRIRIGSSLEPNHSGYVFTASVQITLPGAQGVGESRTHR
jgi:hypothetical protein